MHREPLSARSVVVILCWATVFAVVGSALLTCHGCAPALHYRGPRSPRAQAGTSVRVVSECRMPPVFELADDELHPPYTGSGTQVDAEHVLTADHVVECPVIPTVTIAYADGTRRSMVVEREDATADLALLGTRSARPLPDAPAAEVGPRPAIGDIVCAEVANPSFGRTCGEVTELLDQPKWDVVDQAPIQRGNSGAGVYDLDGRLVGVVSAGMFCGAGSDAFCARVTTSVASHRNLVP